MERVPMVIYNSEIEPQKVDKYSSYINLTPTIANLFNLEYDPRHYMGMDVFSDEYLDLVVFADGSWKNSEVYYDASKGKITQYTDGEIDKDKIKKINNLIHHRLQISSSIIENNYFIYLDKTLNDVDDEIVDDKIKDDKNNKGSDEKIEKQ